MVGGKSFHRLPFQPQEIEETLMNAGFVNIHCKIKKDFKVAT